MSSHPRPSNLVAKLSFALVFASTILGQLAPAQAENLQTDIVYGTKPDGKPLLLDLYLPSQKNPPLIIWIHGGAWLGGDRKNPYPAFAVAAGYAVASIEYRFSNEAVFPAQIQDAHAALDFLTANAQRYGYDPTRIVVAGDSAGGHLSSLLALSKDNPAFFGDKVDSSGRKIVGVVDFYGPSDFTNYFEKPDGMDVKTLTRIFGQLLGEPFSEKSAASKTASPLTYASPQAPPFLIIHGDKDPTVPYEQSVRLKDALTKAGVSCEIITIAGGDHGNVGFTDPAAREALRGKILAFLNRVTQKP